MPKRSETKVMFAGHHIGEVFGRDEDETRDLAAALCLDVLTDMLGSMCNEPGVNRIAQRCRVMDCLEKGFGPMRFDVVHVEAGTVSGGVGKRWKTPAKCYVTAKTTAQPATVESVLVHAPGLEYGGER